MDKWKDFIYALACFAYCMPVGGAVYEHLAVVPQWSAAPPASLLMFQGEYGLNGGAFWPLIHPVVLLLMIISLALHWKTPRMQNILITLGGYMLVLVITALYFVPELMDITGSPYSETTDPSLTSRASLWEKLSLIRLLFIMVLVPVLLLGLTKPGYRTSRKV